MHDKENVKAVGQIFPTKVPQNIAGGGGFSEKSWNK
jgi:hypothetical protein